MSTGFVAIRWTLVHLVRVIIMPRVPRQDQVCTYVRAKLVTVAMARVAPKSTLVRADLAISMLPARKLDLVRSPANATLAIVVWVPKVPVSRSMHVPVHHVIQKRHARRAVLARSSARAKLGGKGMGSLASKSIPAYRILAPSTPSAPTWALVTQVANVGQASWAMV